MNNIYDSQTIDYSRLKNLSSENRIEALYTQTPHSLSRVCLQCIDLGYETSISHNAIVSDMVCAVKLFGEKARLGDQLAINTLGRFSYHITGNGRLRYAYITRLAADKVHFDNEISSAYEKAISALHERPKYVRFVKDISDETAQKVASVIDNSDIPQADEQY